MLSSELRMRPFDLRAQPIELRMHLARLGLCLQATRLGERVLLSVISREIRLGESILS